MNRTDYFNYIEEKLNTLATRTKLRGKLNVLDLNVQSENFYMYLLNEIFHWNLCNLNNKLQNVEAIDLIDHSNKIVVQVSATNTKDKIQSALNKKRLEQYPDYTFKFISISKDADELRNKVYINPHNIKFNPQNDIIDTLSILKLILSLSVKEQRRIYELIKDELGDEINIGKLDTNLAAIINILSREDWSKSDPVISINIFEIERKITFNKLNTAKCLINDYTVHHLRVDKIYSEFDLSGVNKSTSVLEMIRNEYIKNSRITSDDDLFFIVINKVKERILHSANYVHIPLDELELSVNILVVDAFIRCKIFEKP